MISFCHWFAPAVLCNCYPILCFLRVHCLYSIIPLSHLSTKELPISPARMTTNSEIAGGLHPHKIPVILLPDGEFRCPVQSCKWTFQAIKSVEKHVSKKHAGYSPSNYLPSSTPQTVKWVVEGGEPKGDVVYIGGKGQACWANMDGHEKEDKSSVKLMCITNPCCPSLESSFPNIESWKDHCHQKHNMYLLVSDGNQYSIIIQGLCTL